jgi:hypothetical protein
MYIDERGTTELHTLRNDKVAMMNVHVTNN